MLGSGSSLEPSVSLNQNLPFALHTMADADVRLTTVSKDGAKMGSVIPPGSMSLSDGKAWGGTCVQWACNTIQISLYI